MTAVELVNLKKKWNPKAIRELKRGLGLNQRAFAEAVGVSESCISRWVSEYDNVTRSPSGPALEALERLQSTLEDMRESQAEQEAEESIP